MKRHYFNLLLSFLFGAICAVLVFALIQRLRPVASPAMPIVVNLPQLLLQAPGDGVPAHVDLLTSANRIRAYGLDEVELVALVRDRAGNPTNGHLSVRISGADFPASLLIVPYQEGLAVWRWRSRGGIGRVQVSVQAGEAQAELSLQQIPSAPAQITLKLSPACVRDDGRDIVRLQAEVQDAYGAPVVEGSLVHFSAPALNWQSLGIVVNGQATVRLAAPTRSGSWWFYARSDQHMSATTLQVITAQDETCP